MNFREILSTKTLKQSVGTLSATFLNGSLGALFFILLARNLTPDKFGIVSLSIVVITLIADIADLGINTGIINFVSKHVHDSVRQKTFLKLALVSKLLIWISLLILGFILAPFISKYVFLKPDLEQTLRYSFLGAGGLILFSFVTYTLQALQKYKQWAFINISMNLLRLIIVSFFVYFSVINIETSLLSYLSVLFFGFFIGFLFLPKGILIASHKEPILNEFFHFNKWVALTIFIAAFASRIDAFLLARITNFSEVGIYSVAMQLTSFLPQVSYAIAVVAAPKLGNFRNDSEAFRYLKKLQLFCLGIAALGLISIPIVSTLLPLMYGDFYKSSVLIFVILFISQMVFLVATPAHQAIIYYFSKPKIAFFISLVLFTLSLTLMPYLIQLFGAGGAATTVLISNTLNLFISLAWVLVQFKLRK